MYQTPKKPAAEAGSWRQSTTKTPFHQSSAMKFQGKTPSRNRATTAKKARKRVSMITGAEEEAVVVAIRMRPMNAKEKDGEAIWEVDSTLNSVVHAVDGTTFTFDKAYSADATTKDVYAGVAKDIVHEALLGINGAIFAYGQTSSGKTYTMQGAGSRKDGDVLEQHGMLQLAGADIFQHIQTVPERSFSIEASVIEVYNDDLRDLLADDNRTLTIRTDSNKTICVNSEKIDVSTYDAFLDVVAKSHKARKVASTAMNERSSRGHTIFRLTIKSQRMSQDEGLSSHMRVSTLDLIDLAGSESVRNSGANDDRQKEGGKINQSLLSLSSVIEALGSTEPTTISYRECKLTYLLKPSLSGHARLAVVCCATPSHRYAFETRSTLQFAQRAKLVKTHRHLPSIMDESSGSSIQILQQELDDLQVMLDKTKQELALANARRVEDSSNEDYVRSLEDSIKSATSELGQRERKLTNLQDFMLRNSHYSKVDANETLSSGDRKRRHSTIDGQLGGESNESGSEALPPSPTSEPRSTKQRIVQVDEVALFREAACAKSAKVVATEMQLQGASVSLHHLSMENAELKSAMDRLQEDKELTEAGLQQQASTSSLIIQQKEREIEELRSADKDGIITQLQHDKELAEAQLQQHLARSSVVIQQKEREIDELKSVDKDGAIAQLQKGKELAEARLQHHLENSSFVIQQKEGEMEALKSANQGLISELDKQNARHKTTVAEKNLKIRALEQELNDSKLRCSALEAQANATTAASNQSDAATRSPTERQFGGTTTSSAENSNQENETEFSMSEDTSRRKGGNLRAIGRVRSSGLPEAVKPKVKVQKPPRIQSKWTGSCVWVQCGKKEEWPAKLLHLVDESSDNTSSQCCEDGFVWVKYDGSWTEELVEKSRVRPMFEDVSNDAREEDPESQPMTFSQESQSQGGPRRSGRARRTPQEGVVAVEQRVKSEVAEAAANRPSRQKPKIKNQPPVAALVLPSSPKRSSKAPAKVHKKGAIVKKKLAAKSLNKKPLQQLTNNSASRSTSEQGQGKPSRPADSLTERHLPVVQQANMSSTINGQPASSTTENWTLDDSDEEDDSGMFIPSALSQPSSSQVNA